MLPLAEDYQVHVDLVNLFFAGNLTELIDSSPDVANDVATFSLNQDGHSAYQLAKASGHLECGKILKQAAIDSGNARFGGAENDRLSNLAAGN
jgi:ankyrin repeat protein